MNSAKEIIAVASLIIAALVILALLKKEKSEGLKIFLFWGIVLPVMFTTGYLTLGTILKNQGSATGGPVHWHADYEIFVCGQRPAAPHSQVQGQIIAHSEGEVEHEEIDLKDPEGFSNRIGSSDFHEHGDNRIHVEGVVEKLEAVNLAKFFEVIGGHLSAKLIRVPTNHGELIFQNGMDCPGQGQGLLQVFLYKTRHNIVTQEKLKNFADYVLSPYGAVPPGDCLIIEFGPEKNKTENICKFYDIAIKKGELKYYGP